MIFIRFSPKKSNQQPQVRFKHEELQKCFPPGYTGNSVESWLRRAWLRLTQAEFGKVIAKDWLIDYYSG